MRVQASAAHPPNLPDQWKDRWEGPDKGLLAAWRRGLEKRIESPELVACAMANELPGLAWRGGVEKPIKGPKAGTLLYLATWTGLRGEDLDLDTDAEIQRTCSRHGVTVIFSARIPTEVDDHDEHLRTAGRSL